MKKTLLIALSVLCLGVLSGCQDWLSIPSPTQMDSETVFTDIRAAEMATLAVYDASINQEIYHHFIINGDDARVGEDGYNAQAQLAHFDYIPSQTPHGLYTAMYKGIERANSILKKLPGYTPANAEEEVLKNMLIGECLALRAQDYLHLIRLFGDVPFTTTPFEDAASFSLGRTSRDVIYDQIIADLQQAVELLPWKSAGKVQTNERITKNAAYGMLARTALYAAGFSLRWDLETYSSASLKVAQRPDQTRVTELYQIASDACAAVITKGENDLEDSFEDVFRDLINGRYNEETMFEHGHQGATYSPTRNGYTNGMAIMRGNTNFGRSYPMQRAMPTLWFDYKDGDTRRGVSVVNYGIDAASNHHLHAYSQAGTGKYRVNWYESPRQGDATRGINWIWLRYSDVLLMYAEAQNELNNGPTAAAISAFEQVRTRAFGGNKSLIGTTPASYADFRKAIIEERKLEFAFEGWRKTDLVRFGVHQQVMTETKAKVIRLANRQGEYAAVPRFAAYKPTPAPIGDALVEMVPDYTYMTEPDATEKARLTAGGYTLLNLNGDPKLTSLPSGSGVLMGRFFNVDNNLDTWITDMNNGLVENQSELYPLNQVNIIDVNPGLAGQQHPAYAN